MTIYHCRLPSVYYITHKHISIYAYIKAMSSFRYLWFQLNHRCDLAFSIPLSVPTFVQIWEIALITDVLFFQSYKTSKLASELLYNSPWRSKFTNWCTEFVTAYCVFIPITSNHIFQVTLVLFSLILFNVARLFI